MNEKEILVHDTLDKYLKNHIPVQEITHAGRIIGKAMLTDDKDLIDEAIYEAHSYLQQADKERIPLQTVNTKPITNNLVAIAISRVRAIIGE